MTAVPALEHRSLPAAPRTSFALPAGAEASEPPEHRGLARDEVRMLVARPEHVEHVRVRDLPEQLTPGDLVVVNTSATLPAALTARMGRREVDVHVSTVLDDGDWVVEVRRPDRTGPERGVHHRVSLLLDGGLRLRLREPYPDPSAPTPSRLWRAEATPTVDPAAHLGRYGRPVVYGHLSRRQPLADYQTVYATEPGSAEMPSAGRPFTAALLVRLMARGVPVVPVVLHAGVSSPELHEPPTPERFAVPEVTARLVASTRAAGHRVVAVGTTVVRALESATDPDGSVRAARGWTDLVLGPDRPPRAVTGLLTGLHEPGASHLLLLEAVAGPRLVATAYDAAVAEAYLWHEFGDSTLLLP